MKATTASTGSADPVGRICIVTSTFPRWRDDNVPQFILDLAIDMTAQGWQVEVLAPHCDGALQAEEMSGIRITRFRYLWPARLETLAYGDGGAIQNLRKKPLNGLKLPFFFIAQLASLYRLVNRERIDVINSHWLIPQGLAAAFVSRITQIPHVATVHGGDVLGLTSTLFLSAKRIALKKAVACTANSSVTESAVRALAPPDLDIERIPLGADPRPFTETGLVQEIRNQYAKPSEFLMLFVGRLIPQKGCHDLLAAMRLIVDSRQDTRLIIAGDGPEKRTLEEFAAKNDILGHVDFIGWQERSELDRLYLAADIFVASPARGPGGETEAFGLVFVEAALAALPTVATRSGGIIDIVVDGETGRLVEENNPLQLSLAILELLDDSTKLKCMGQAAKERAEAMFTRERAARSYSSLFRKFLR